MHKDATKDLPLHHRIVRRIQTQSTIEPFGSEKQQQENDTHAKHEAEKHGASLPRLHPVHNKTLPRSTTDFLAKKQPKNYTSLGRSMRRERTVGYVDEHQKERARSKYDRKHAKIIHGVSSDGDVRFNQLQQSLAPPHTTINNEKRFHLLEELDTDNSPFKTKLPTIMKGETF